MLVLRGTFCNVGSNHCGRQDEQHQAGRVSKDACGLPVWEPPGTFAVLDRGGRIVEVS